MFKKRDRYVEGKKSKLTKCKQSQYHECYNNRYLASSQSLKYFDRSLRFKMLSFRVSLREELSFGFDMHEWSTKDENLHIARSQFMCLLTEDRVDM